MDIAIRINSKRLALTSNNRARFIPILQIPDDDTLRGLNTHETNAMFLSHRMQLRTNSHLQCTSIQAFHNRKMLFAITLLLICLEKCHFLTTTMWSNSTCNSSKQQIAASATIIESFFHNFTDFKRLILRLPSSPKIEQPYLRLQSYSENHSHHPLPPTFF